MPIVDLQRRLREVGRIRIGDTVAATSRNGKAIRRPRKLETFRLTSRDRQVVEAAAALWGGSAEPWPEQEGQYAVLTTVDVLPVIVPPTEMAFSQWYESWSGGGCLKRCDGAHDVLRDCPCDCNPEARDCKIHTRLSVILPELQGLGVWRVDTQGYYAATELAGVVEVCQTAAARNQMLPARLRLEQREVKRVTDGKAETRKFAVPVLDVDVAPAALTGTMHPVAGIGAGATPALPAATFTPVEPDDTPPPSIRDQVAESEARQPVRRSNAAAPIPATGVSVRTSADEKSCSRCGQPYGDDPLMKGDAGESRFVHRDCGTAEPQAESLALITSPQSKMLHALLGKAGVTDDDRHATLSAMVGREITSTNDLTKAEASTCIDHLNDEVDKQKPGTA